jgi:hypothetical protein
MKKITTFILLFYTINSAQAQYKKASFLTKSGRTYELGINTRLIGGGNKTAIGYLFTYGRETNTKKMFHWFDIDFTPRTYYAFNTTGDIDIQLGAKDVPVNVNGRTASTFSYKFNVGYHLLDNNNEKNKLLPFVNLSTGFIIAFKDGIEYTTTPSNVTNLKKYVVDGNSVIALGGGVGVLYKFTPKFAIRSTVNYYSTINIDRPLIIKEGYSKFMTMKAHPNITLALRWTIDKETD